MLQVWLNQVNRKGAVKPVLVDEVQPSSIEDQVSFWQSSECCQPSILYPVVFIGVACLIPIQASEGWTDEEIEAFTAFTPEEHALSQGRSFS